MVRDSDSYRAARRAAIKRAAQEFARGVSSSNEGHGGIFKTAATIIATGTVALLLALITAALTFYGYVGVNIARIFMVIAWLVAAISLSALDVTYVSLRRVVHVGIIAAIFLGTGFVFYCATAILESKIPLDAYDGTLEAGNEPTFVSDHCKHLEAESKFIFLAGSTDIFINSFPHVVIVLGGHPVLAISKNSDGVGLLSAEVFDQSGVVLATVKDNVFHVNRNNTFYAERPTKRQLRIFDQKNRKVLDIDYKNTKELYMVGTLYYGPGVTFDETTLSVGGRGTLTAGCSSGSGVDLVVQ